MVTAADRAVNNNIAAETDFFVISRRVYDSATGDRDSTDYKKIGESKRASTVKELRQFFLADQMVQLRKLLSQKTDEQLADFFKTHFAPADYGLAFTLVEIRQAMGEVYLDEDVKAGKVYVYSITRVTRSGEKLPWGYSVTVAGSGNYRLNYYHPILGDRKISDSSITYIWHLALNNDSIKYVVMPPSKVKGELPGVGMGFELSPMAIRGNVFINNNGKYTEVKKIIPTLNKTGDTAVYTYTKGVLPEQSLTAFLATEDEIYNPGISSDTVTTFAVTPRNVPLIKKVTVTDIENGVRLSWDLLPPKPYIIGVMVSRYFENEIIDTLGIFSVSETSYTDYKMQVGKHYTYLVKALYNQDNIEQKVAANAVGTMTLFSRPLPAFNLSAVSAGRNVQLTWEVIKGRGYYGSYIYRGVSQGKLDRIAGPVFTTSYLDSSQSLSGRSPYYYTVVTQNLRQDTSVYADLARIIPNRVIESEQSQMIKFYFANNVLRVEWNDVRKRDQAINGYLIKRSLKGENNFNVLTAEPLTNNFFEDSTIMPSASYQYRVATVNFKGEVGAYGEVSEFSPTKNEVALINVFFIRNIVDGVHVSWPQAEIKNRKGYNIFRREASVEIFTKLASVNSSTFFFIDNTVKQNVTYVYSMSVTEDDGRSGERGESKSIKSEQTNVTPIL